LPHTVLLLPETKKIPKLFDKTAVFDNKTVKETQDVDGGMGMTNGADQAANVNDLAGGGGCSSGSWNHGGYDHGCRVHNSGCGM
jgi:hypothetical protein